MFIVYNTVMFKVPMKRYSLMGFSRLSSSKCTIPKFAASTVKIEDFSSVESWFIFPQKNSIQIARRANEDQNSATRLKVAVSGKVQKKRGRENKNGG